MDYTRVSCPAAEAILRKCVRVTIYEVMTEGYLRSGAAAIGKVVASTPPWSGGGVPGTRSRAASGPWQVEPALSPFIDRGHISFHPPRPRASACTAFEATYPRAALRHSFTDAPFASRACRYSPVHDASPPPARPFNRILTNRPIRPGKGRKDDGVSCPLLAEPRYGDGPCAGQPATETTAADMPGGWARTFEAIGRCSPPPQVMQAFPPAAFPLPWHRQQRIHDLQEGTLTSRWIRTAIDRALNSAFFRSTESSHRRGASPGPRSGAWPDARVSPGRRRWWDRRAGREAGRPRATAPRPTTRSRHVTVPAHRSWPPRTPRRRRVRCRHPDREATLDFPLPVHHTVPTPHGGGPSPRAIPPIVATDSPSSSAFDRAASPRHAVSGPKAVSVPRPGILARCVGGTAPVAAVAVAQGLARRPFRRIRRVQFRPAHR